MMEQVRRLFRSIFKYDSRIYRFGAAFLDFLATLQSDGYGTWRRLRMLDRGRDRNPRPVTLKRLMHPLVVRPGTHDAGTVVNTVIREEYGHDLPEMAPCWMVDAGAYIGDTSAYFLSRYPSLRVVALEPHPANHAMAEVNLAPYGERVILLRKGLSSSAGEAAFSGEGTGAAIGEGEMRIDCTTLPELMDRFSIPRIDILKLDIEGAEEALFSSDPAPWLARVDLIIMEIHGERIRELISRVLDSNGFNMRKYRSVWYCRPACG